MAIETTRDGPVFFVRVSPRGLRGETAKRIDSTEVSITSFDFTDTEEKADTLVLTIDNFDLAHFDSGIWKKGQVLEFAWGYPSRMTEPRKAVIQKVTGFEVLTIEARAESVLLDQDKRARSFSNKKRSQVVEEIAREHGYKGPRIDIEDTEVVHETITQGRMTDAQFLRHLANKEGFEFYVDATGLHFHKRRFDAPPIKTLTYYLDQREGDIESIMLDNDITAKPSKVVRKGRDPIKKKDVEGVGDNDSLSDESTLGDFVELIDRETGERAGTADINTVNEDVAPTAETSEEAAERSAKGAYRKSKASAIQMTIKMVGDPDMLAKQIFVLNIPSKRLAGKYHVSEAKHSIGNSGYTTTLKVRRDAGSSNVGLSGSEGIEAEGKKNKKDSGEGVLLIEQIDEATGQSQLKFFNRGKR